MYILYIRTYAKHTTLRTVRIQYVVRIRSTNVTAMRFRMVSSCFYSLYSHHMKHTIKRQDGRRTLDFERNTHIMQNNKSMELHYSHDTNLFRIIVIKFAMMIRIYHQPFTSISLL